MKQKWTEKPDPVKKSEKRPPKKCKCGQYMDSVATECGICGKPM